MLETPAEMAKRFQNRFSALFHEVWDDHKACNPEGGHDFGHALMAAQYATIISDEELKDCSWVAGFLHNSDRLFPEKVVELQVRQYLYMTDFSSPEKKAILEAIMCHSELNRPEDSPLTIVLKDADRLAGLGPISPIRAGQSFPKIFALDPRYASGISPGSTYKNPATILDCMRFTMEWKKMLRLPKAKMLAEELCRRHQEYIEFLERQVKELGLDAFDF